MYKKKTLRESIPNLDGLFKKVVKFVKANQGEKGYIDCQPFKADDDGTIRGDIIYGIVFDEAEDCGVEKYVYGVRVVDNDIEILLESVTRTYRTVYKNSDFINSDEWLSLRWSEVYYVPTLFNIAEAIEEYVE